VVLHSKREGVENCAERVKEFLNGMGLWLNEKKTRMTQTLQEVDGNKGFNFLGYNVRQYPVGKYHTGRNTHGIPLGYKTLIKPSEAAMKRHMDEIGRTIRMATEIGR